MDNQETGTDNQHRNLFAAGFDMGNMSMGLYGVGIAAVGMLSTLGITF